MIHLFISEDEARLLVAILEVYETRILGVITLDDPAARFYLNQRDNVNDLDRRLVALLDARVTAAYETTEADDATSS